MLCLEEMGEVQAPSTSMNASSLPLPTCVLRNIFSVLYFRGEGRWRWYQLLHDDEGRGGLQCRLKFNSGQEADLKTLWHQLSDYTTDGNDETVSQGGSGQYIDQLQFLVTDGSSYGPYGDLSSHCILIYILLCREQCSLWASFPFCGRSHFLFAGGGGAWLSTRFKLKISTKIQLRNLKFRYSTKHQQQNTDQTSVSKSRLNFIFKLLTKPCAESLNKS